MYILLGSYVRHDESPDGAQGLVDPVNVAPRAEGRGLSLGSRHLLSTSGNDMGCLGMFYGTNEVYENGKIVNLVNLTADEVM